MSRERIDYSQRYADRANAAGPVGFDADKPIEGYYRMRLRSGAAYCGVRIWHGAPLDPLTGEEMDRGHRWQALVNGSLFDLARVWPKCAADPVDEAEYRYLCEVHSWAREHAPDSPQANPMRRIDPLTAPTPF